MAKRAAAAKTPKGVKAAKKKSSSQRGRKKATGYSGAEFEGAQQLYEQSGDVEAVKQHAKQSKHRGGVSSAADDVAKAPKGRRASRRTVKRNSPGSRG